MFGAGYSRCLQKMKGTWRFEPVDEGRILVVIRVCSHPDGLENV